MKTLKMWEICQNEAPRSEVFVDQHVILWIYPPSDGKREFLVDGLLANLGVSTVSLFRSSLLATGLSVHHLHHQDSKREAFLDKESMTS